MSLGNAMGEKLNFLRVDWEISKNELRQKWEKTTGRGGD